MFFTETEFSSSKHSFNSSLSLRERAVIWWNSKQHSNWKEALKGVPKKLNITNMKFGIWKTWHKLEWINKRVNVFKRCYFWYFVSGHQFLRLLTEIILWVTFLVRSVMLNVFIQSMKSELNRTLFTLIFEVSVRSFWVFCKVNKGKTTCGLPCFLIEFMVSVEKLGCAFKVFWIMVKYWNVWILNQVIFLGKPSLHDPLWKLFFEQLFGDFISLTLYICF